MAKALIFYPGPIHFREAQVALHRPALEELGLELVLADDRLSPSDSDYFADTIELPSAQYVSASLRCVERWLRTNEAHAVVAQSEAGLLLGALAAARLGVPCISPEAAHLTTNKFRCREVLHDAGVAQPRFTLARTAQDVRAFASTVGYPVVLKGIASALGRLVTLVRDEGAVEHCVARVRSGLDTSVDIARLVDFGHVLGCDLGCDPHTDFLVEAFAHGDPVETDGVVSGLEIRNFGVTEQELSQPPFFFMEGYLLPAQRSAAELQAIEAISDRALTSLGVANTGFSNEMRFHAGAASIIEINGRLGWDEGFGDMFALATGAQPAFQMLEVALGRRSEFSRRTDLHAALAYAMCYEDRIVERIPTASEIETIERECDVRIGLAVHAGDRMYAPPHAETSPHLAFALASGDATSRASYARARRAVDKLRFGLTSVPPPSAAAL
ncbi:MAG: hypothetical protein JNL28_10350 [Planctomycetes bacterium]|nr:hypothetical protein [Planctomycetota bacterium]